MGKTNKISVSIYEVKVCDGVMALVHNQYRTIKEIFIPEETISFNVVDGDCHCWRSCGSRYLPDNAKLLGTCYISSVSLNAIKKYIETREDLDKKIKEETSRILKTAGISS